MQLIFATDFGEIAILEANVRHSPEWDQPHSSAIALSISLPGYS